MLQTALDLQAAGLCVIPLRERSKRPAGTWKAYQAHQPSVPDLRRWFGHSQRNLAVVCGQVSGPEGLSLAVLDFDRPGFDGWAADHPEIAMNTWISASGRQGGRHVWLLVPGEVPSTVFAYGEVKAEGGYIVAPHSIHPNGKPYRWLHRQDQILVVETLQGLGLGVKRRQELPAGALPPVLAMADEKLIQQILAMAIQRASNGSRNHTGFWLAAQLRDNGADYEQAKRVLFDYHGAVTNLGDHPYRLGEAWGSLRSAYSSPPRQPWQAYRK